MVAAVGTLGVLPSFLGRHFFDGNALAAAPVANSAKMGRETGMPVPRFVSLKSGKAFLRAGPGDAWAVVWVYQKRELPLQIVDEYDHWRKVRDIDGAEGWLHKNLLTGTRTALTTVPMQPVYQTPNAASKVTAQLDKDVIIGLRECRADWCKIGDKRFVGWVPRSSIWGVLPQENQL